MAQLTPTFLHEVQAKSVPVWQALQTEIGPLAAVAGISGKGLMIGIQLATTVDVNQVIDQLQQAGILTLSAKHNTLRLLPPLVMSSADLLAGLAQIKTVLTTIGEE